MDRDVGAKRNKEPTSFLIFAGTKPHSA
jgi:hypothetical protein